MTTVSLRRRRPGYHPAAGRTLVVAGAHIGEGVLAHDLSIASAWLINLAVAKCAVRRRPAPRRRPRPAVVGAQP